MYPTQQRRPQTPVSQIIEDYASITSEDESIHTRSAPQSYRLVNVHQPDGSLTTIRRNLSARDSGERRQVMASNTAPRAAKGACRTVLARSSDGSWRRVQRPVRDSELFVTSRAQASHSEPLPPSASVRSSSIYDDDASRGTMISTMTLVETALAEQQTYQRSRCIQLHGHSANESSATGTSGASGNIEIGHIDENEESGRSRRYSASDYGDAGGQGVEFGREDHLTIHRSRSAHERYNTSGSQAAFREYGPAAPVALPGPLAAVRHSNDSSASNRSTDKLQRQAREGYVRDSSLEAAMRPWLQRLVRSCSYILASCSVVLPAAFIALGIVVIFMRGKPVSSGWASVADLVEISAAIWPIVFATTVAQSFKAGIILRRNASTAGRVGGGCAKRDLTLPRLEALCLLVFLVWCLSPIGQLAARNMYGNTQETLQGHRDVLYMDNTGRNQVWDPKSTNTLSPRSRSELIQTIGAKYIRSLSRDNLDSPFDEPISTSSQPKSTLVGSIVSHGSMKDASLAHGIRARDQMASNTHEAVSISADLDALNFSMTSSSFNFKCGDWTLMTRYLSNDTLPEQISYSASQTLGLRMAGQDDSGSPPTVRFVSLNRRSISNATMLRRRPLNSANLTVNQWEYSSINCNYEQAFYNVPMQCSRDNSGGIKACAQSGAAQLIPSDGTLTTPLGDFALDFVWSGNLPTTDMAATATEQYIQRGGSSDNRRFTRARDVRNPRFNLSATVSPDEFARRFGRLFSTWVGLGYCPQCSSDIVANSTSIPASLQPRYRKVSSTVIWSGERVYTVNWPWLTGFMVSTSLMLVAAVGAIAAETLSVAKAVKGKTVRRPISKDDIVPLRLPTMYSTVSDSQRSPQWGKVVMQDMNTATGAGYSWGMYG